MKKTAKKKATKEEGSPQLVLGLAEIVRDDLRAFVVTAGVAALTVLLEQERTRARGPATSTRATARPGAPATRRGSW